VVIPRSLTTDTQRFSGMTTKYENFVRKLDFDGGRDILIKNLPKAEQTEEVIKELERLTEELVFLQNNKWNGIWARIIANFLATANLGSVSI
jgi:hypothetical protein